MSIKDFEIKVNQLLTKRKMMPTEKIGVSTFCKYFLAHAWLAHSKNSNGFEMLDVLLDDDLLIGGEQFNKNFILKFEDLYPAALKNNKTWQMLMPRLVDFTGKSLGVGELYLALVIQGWTFERTNGKGDGKVAGGIREIKKNGASLKPLTEALRVQDALNASIFKGVRAGPVTKFENHKRWIDTQPSPEKIYLEYFSQLYPNRDVSKMCRELALVQTGQEFNNIIGRNVLQWYKDIDSWSSLIIIDQDKGKIVNIADVTDLSMFKDIRFNWKSERGGDIQAFSDGYVNIRI